MESVGINRKGGMVVGNQRKAFEGIKLENPFTFKVLQVFTGFGVGCGVGIGVGRPINLGALPMVGQVMSATRGATDALSGVGRHVNDAMRKLGAKNIEAGIGCGVGFGHGFGIGLAVKPGVLHQIQSCIVQAMTKLTMKFGMPPNLLTSQGAFPLSLQSGVATINEPSIQSPIGSVMQMAPKIPDHPFQGLAEQRNMATSKSSVETSFGRTEKVISGFLENPLVKEDETRINDLARKLQSENNMLQMVLKHQQVIEELMEENEKLRQILMEDLKVPPTKLQSGYLSKTKSPCSECFECRRKQRKGR